MSDCRLYLVTPPDLVPATFLDPLAAALAAGDVACVLLAPPPGAPAAAVLAMVDALRPTVQGSGAAFLVADRPGLAADRGCDGVHLSPDGPPYLESRRTVGETGIVGMACGLSRHDAMSFGEMGADYVWFAAAPGEDAALADRIGWWNELMEVPCVAATDAPADDAVCDRLIAAGADFLAVRQGVWRHPEGPARAVETLQNRIDAHAAD